MDAVKHQLLNYDALPATERDEVDAHLAAHPEAQALVDEGRALRAFLSEAAQTGAALPDAEEIARYLAAQYFGHQPLSPALTALGQRVEAAFASHPEVERQYSIMRDRLERLNASAESPAEQFERLVGYRLDAPVPDHLEADVPEPAVPAHGATSKSQHRSWRAPADREAVPLLRRVSVSRLALAASVLLTLVYGGLFIASGAQQTEYERLAELDSAPTDYEGLRLRGVDGLMDPAAERYAEALDELGDARSSFLGLFPSYDAERVDTALGLLREVTELEGDDAALGLEAWFLIGQILLHDGDTEAAREAFQIVVDRQGPSAPDARRLLDATAPPGTPASPPNAP